MRLLFVFLFVLLSHITYAQVIWQETFTYPDVTTTGANNNTDNPAADWTSSCSTCLTGDYFQVMSGQMKGKDTNGPAELLTEVINISAFPAGVELSLDIDKNGDMEGCTAGVSCGCNCVDFVRVQISLDGGAFTDLSSVNGGACSGGCTDGGGSFVALDDFSAFTFVECPIIANTIQVRIRVQEWAASEEHMLDNLTISAQNCPLPIRFDAFSATNSDQGVVLNWATSMEENLDEFWVERSLDGSQFEVISALPISQQPVVSESFYSYTDESALPGAAFYRIAAVDRDGTTNYSEIIKVAPNFGTDSKVWVYPNPARDRVEFSGMEPGSVVTLLDAQGRILRKSVADGNSMIWNISDIPAGLFWYRAETGRTSQFGKIIVE